MYILCAYLSPGHRAWIGCTEGYSEVKNILCMFRVQAVSTLGKE